MAKVCKNLSDVNLYCLDMTIVSITEQPNNEMKKQKPIKEVMDINVPDIPEGISRRNGAIYLLVGSGGSGKSSLLLGQFRRGGAYHKKFHNVYYFVPSASFASVQNHPFEKHERVYHELTADGLYELHDELLDRKNENAEEEEPTEYNAVILDDFANDLKDKNIVRALNKMLIKARHLNTTFIFTLQSFLYMPKILRKQVTFATIFRPRNSEEWDTIRREILQMKEEDAKKVFDYIFNEPYMHLDVDAFENKFYKNFNPLTITNNDNL
jgi:hypothetical protein